jgi:acetyl-CoA/propionyl-CoA carboxylase biotin carboxyl carrier protein
MKYRVTVSGKTFDVHVEDGPEGTLAAVRPSAGDGDGNGARPPLRPVTLARRGGSLASLVDERGALGVSVDAGIEDGVYEVQLPGSRVLTCAVEDERARLARRASAAASGGKAGPRTVRSIMPGIVLSLRVEVGASVAVKDALLVVEAMKMQNEIRAEVAGTITKIHVKAGQSVAAGAPLLEIAPPAT